MCISMPTQKLFPSKIFTFFTSDTLDAVCTETISHGLDKICWEKLRGKSSDILNCAARDGCWRINHIEDFISHDSVGSDFLHKFTSFLSYFPMVKIW